MITEKFIKEEINKLIIDIELKKYVSKLLTKYSFTNALTEILVSLIEIQNRVKNLKEIKDENKIRS